VYRKLGGSAQKVRRMCTEGWEEVHRRYTESRENVYRKWGEIKNKYSKWRVATKEKRFIKPVAISVTEVRRNITRPTDKRCFLLLTG
jgi:hypothetical protein